MSLGDLDSESWLIWALAQPTPVVLVRDGVVVEGNRAVASLFGLTAGELVGLPVHEILIERSGITMRDPTVGRPVGVLRGGEWVEQVVTEMPVRDGVRAMAFAAPSSLPTEPAPAPVTTDLVLGIGDFVARRSTNAHSIGRHVLAELSEELGAATRWTGVEAANVLRVVAHVDPADIYTGETREEHDLPVLDIERRAAAGRVAVEATTLGIDWPRSGPAIVVPVSRGGRVVGTLCAVLPASGTPFRLDQVELIHAAADHLGMVESLLRAEEADAALAASQEDMRLFGSALAHDLRAPIRHIAAFGELARSDLATGDFDLEQVCTNLERILTSADRVTDQLNAMVEYIRGADVDFSAVSVMSLIEPAVDRARELAAGGEILVGRVEGLVHTDPSVAAVILDNLLGNAIKYAHPDRSLHVEVDTTMTAARRTVRVTDNGIGLPEGREEYAFAAFRRLHPQLDRPGSGMGLTISRRMARLLHAELSARRLEIGTCFSLSMPRAD